MSAALPFIQTSRLTLRKLRLSDHAFILALVNDPDWLRHIGNRNVHTSDAARDFIQQGPVAHYRQFGFGLYLVELTQSATPLGLCGLIQRDFLDYPDIGYALLPAFRGAGISFEACQAVIRHDSAQHHISFLHAMVSPDNAVSIALIRKLGFATPPCLLKRDEQATLLFGQQVAQLRV